MWGVSLKCWSVKWWIYLLWTDSVCIKSNDQKGYIAKRKCGSRHLQIFAQMVNINSYKIVELKLLKLTIIIVLWHIFMGCNGTAQNLLSI